MKGQHKAKALNHRSLCSPYRADAYDFSFSEGDALGYNVQRFQRQEYAQGVWATARRGLTPRVSVLMLTIPILNLVLGFLPVVAVVIILFRWSIPTRTTWYASARMVAQLLIIGYLLTFIFETKQPGVIMGVLCVMMLAASWIALRPVKDRAGAYPKALISIVAGSVPVLALVTQRVLSMETWFQPKFVVPLAGMIFSQSMNAVSLAAERFSAESERGKDYAQCRNIALTAALIPITNSLFAVGLVALPGMMTGQILSGIDPLIAVRYQIMVMCMAFGAGGISAATYLRLIRPEGPDS